VTLTQALAMSLNTVAVRLGLEVGPQNVVRTAHRLGIASKLEPNATISLGTSEVSPTELVGAYATFANNGIAVSPHVITRIKAADTGKVLYVRPPDPASQVVDPRYVAMMNAMMHETLVIGTAKRADIPGWYAAGKTGTSQDFRDAWFVGYTAHLVTGVWLGNDDSSPTKKATGGGLPVEVWTRFMKAAHQGVPVANLLVPQAGNPISDFFQSFSRGGGRPAPAQLGAAPSDQAVYDNRSQSYGAARNSPPVYPSRSGNTQPRPAQTSGRPEDSAGLSGGGWLMDRLFGGR
jgi:penicillin-binding protein 1A